MPELKTKTITMGGHQWLDSDATKNGSVVRFSANDIYIKEDFGLWTHFFDDIYHLGHESWPNCNSSGAYCPLKLKHGLL